MKKLMAKYKQFLFGFTLGVLLPIGLAFWSASGNEPFQSVPYVIREIKNDTIVQTPKFCIIYRGVAGVNASGNMTISGTRGDFESPFSRGYGTSIGGTDIGITNINLYDSSQGIATMYVAGQLFRIMNSGTTLIANNISADMKSSRPVVVVEKDKHAHLGSEADVKALTGPSEMEYGSTAPPQF
jgi:hypothetical protein